MSALTLTAPDRRSAVISDSTLRAFVGYNMKRAYMKIQNDLVRVLQKDGLRLSAFTALVLIVDNPDMVQSQLADALGIKRSGAVLLVDHLEERGLTTRNKVPGDRRAHALRATVTGTRLRDRVLANVHKHEDEILQNLNPQQRQNLLELLALVENKSTES